jgi:UDP-glucuronate 4-epimerase
MESSVLVTGGAGFIGSHLVDRLLDAGCRVTVLDNFDPYYDPDQKHENIQGHRAHSGYQLVEGSVTNPEALAHCEDCYDSIVHLAAKAGVRPSLEHPQEYQQVNLLGTQRLLEKAREWGVPQFIFGSSSSVYGVNPEVPWEETQTSLQPISPYASSKLSAEMLGHVYSHTYDLQFLGLRFFTVYGARQRPDLAIHKFARRMIQGEVLPLYGDGTTYRDYTHVADIVSGIRAAMDYTREAHGIFNLGTGTPVTLDELVKGLERALGVEARREYLPQQPGDVPRTLASIEKAKTTLEYNPTVGLDEGLQDFAEWVTTSTVV